MSPRPRSSSGPAPSEELAERIHELGAKAVIVTGGHGAPVDHLFDGVCHVAIPVERHEVASTHGAGCTHSATLAALLAHGEPLDAAAIGGAAEAPRGRSRRVIPTSARETGPVDVLRGAA